MLIIGSWIVHLTPTLASCPDPIVAERKRGLGYNTSNLTLEGHNQHTIVSDHVIIYAIYGVLSMPRDRIAELITLTML